MAKTRLATETLKAKDFDEQAQVINGEAQVINSLSKESLRIPKGTLKESLRNPSFKESLSWDSLRTR